MALNPGTRIGAYEIGALLGSGGMGEVYRARDIRLGRDVALKLLSDELGIGPDRFVRFEQEARATAALSHPHVVAIYDVGSWGGQPFLVSEFLDGQTLRTLLNEGPLPIRKAVEYATQIARGLAAAHRRGIVHRDLKPENLIITRDGVVKILDFGLAKVTELARHLQVASQTTAPGIVLGTLGYLSPEQAKGEASDERADIFSFGAVFYEMIAGRRAFQGASPAETLSAVLKETPPDLERVVPGLPPAITRIVDRCLEKNKDERFQTAGDLGFALDALAGSSWTAQHVPRRRWPRFRWAAIVALLALAVGGGFAAGKRLTRADVGEFRQLTFRRGTVQSARFAADGHTVVYAASWEGKPAELYSTRPEAVEARPLGMPSTGLFALSANGEMAVALDPIGYGRVEGTLGRAALAGGPARKLVNNVLAADWSPDGSTLAIVHSIGGDHDVLEYPPGRVLYDPAPGNITHIRFSPRGDAIAILLHPVAGDTAGSVVLVDLEGNARTLSSGWNTVLGLAWGPGGKEVWFTGTRAGATQALYAVTLSGEERRLLRAPAMLTLHDVSADGRALVSRDAWGAGVMATGPGSASEHDLSWLDGSLAWDISADGSAIILEESWEGGGANHSIYLRSTDGAPAVRLGEGVPLALSTDKQWVIAANVAGDQLVVLPTGVGQPKTLPRGKVTTYVPAARWIPGDARRFLISGTEGGRPGRVYVQSIDSGDPVPVTPEGAYGRLAMLPDGQTFVTRGVDRKLARFSLAGGEPRPVTGAEPRDVPIVVTPDGEWLYVERNRQMPGEVSRINLRTGQREPVRTLLPPDPAGVTTILRVVMTPDARSYAYSFVRALSSLYLVDALE